MTKPDTAARQPWPAETVELVPIEALVPNARNARTHSASQVRALADKMLEVGWTSAALRDETNGIIAGHGRILAAALNVKRGHARFAQAPVMTARGWTEEQKRAYLLYDNQIALKAGWDLDILRGELRDLEDLGVDLETLGYSEVELRDFEVPGHTQSEKNAEADKTPPVPPKPVVRAGELWLLGDHRLLIGDSTSAPIVKRLLGDVIPNLMVTDPPYGVEYDPNWRNSADRSTKIKGRKISATATGKVQNDGRADWTEAWLLFPGNVVYVWHSGVRSAEVFESLERANFLIRSQIIWNKQTHIIGRGDYHWKHEPCWYAVRKGERSNFNRAGAEGRKQNTVWDIAHRASETGHGTQKPIECMRRPILNNTKQGEAVYDPFLGSGTTLISAHMEGRRAFGCEIDPAYGQVIIERFETFTGLTATQEDGKTLADLKTTKKGSKTK